MVTRFWIKVKHIVIYQAGFGHDIYFSTDCFYVFGPCIVI